MNKNKKMKSQIKRKNRRLLRKNNGSPENSGLRFAEKLSYLISQVSFVSSNSLNEW